MTKLNPPKPNGDASAKKSASKPKKKVVAPKPDEIEEEAKPQMTEAEKLQQREKAVLYLRHRLQKGFLSRDQAPQESEMSAMADFFTQLENYENLEPSIIRVTKIHKVLKAIVKLVTIPKDEEYNFKKRSAAMLEIWNKRMESDGDAAPASAVEPKSATTAEEKEISKAPETNGETAVQPAGEAATNDESEAKEGAEKEIEAKGEEKVAEEAADKIEEKAVDAAEKDQTMQDVSEPPEAPVEKTAAPDLGNDAKDEAEVGDVSMQTAPEEATAEVA